MSTLFLFGAGASHGSGPCIPSRPPLGSQLFAEMRNAGGLAARVSEQLAQEFENFERGMDMFWDERPGDVAELLRDMSKYLVQFEPAPGNHYISLLQLIQETGCDAILATTNYDVLIELAAHHRRRSIGYHAFPRPPQNNIPLLKIHGSVNFLPDTRGAVFNDCKFIQDADRGGSAFVGPVKVASSAAEVLAFCRDENSLAPCVAAYHPKKKVLFSKEYIDFHQEQFRSAVESADRIVVIGLRIHAPDVHIWKPIAESQGNLFFVGFEPDEFESWKEKTARDSAQFLTTSFEEALPLIEKILMERE
ncbi:MAG: hypothetical protein AB7Q37_18320 [Pyrinomonadaceae bacterium]